MGRIALSLKCPRCRSRAQIRIQRRDWMHLVPGVRHHGCDDCGAKFVSVFRRLTMLTRS